MHIPVMLKETIDALMPVPGGKYIDGTLGGGGHSEELLRRSSPDGRLLGIDRDPAAIKRCKVRFASFGERFVPVHAAYSEMEEAAREHGFEGANGIIMDLGVSSFQLDEAGRGFSFMDDGPLDMRMDNSSGQTAAEYIASFGSDWKSLAGVLRKYGEEPNAGTIARRIVLENEKHPIETTGRLAEIVSEAVGGRRGARRHPATKTFQAIRIAVNNEPEEIRRGVEAAINLLAAGGRLAVISFHSIEDRIVKQIFVCHEGKNISLRQGGAEWEVKEPAVTRVTRRPITPSAEELASNPRARSAKLRIVCRGNRRETSK